MTRPVFISLLGMALFFAACSKDDPIYHTVPPVSVQEEVNDTLTQLMCAPNPADSMATVSFRLTRQQKVQVNVYNLFGQTVFANTNFTGVTGYNAQVLDLSGWPQGMYLVRITTNKRTYTLKIIKS